MSDFESESSESSLIQNCIPFSTNEKVDQKSLNIQKKEKVKLFRFYMINIF